MVVDVELEVNSSMLKPAGAIALGWEGKAVVRSQQPPRKKRRLQGVAAAAAAAASGSDEGGNASAAEGSEKPAPTRKSRRGRVQPL